MSYASLKNKIRLFWAIVFCIPLVELSDEQSCSLQGWLSSPKDPLESHSAPPFSGAGLSQVRVLLWVPPSHVAEQVPHLPHRDHLPSTAWKNIKLENLLNISIIYHINISCSTYAILSCIKLPLSVQTRMAFFPFLPFWEHFLFPPLKHGLLSLKFFGFVNWIPNSVHADLHSSMPVIFDPPVHCLCKK